MDDAALTAKISAVYGFSQREAEELLLLFRVYYRRLMISQHSEAVKDVSVKGAV